MRRDACTRPAEPKDIPALKRIWTTAFGDTEAAVERFFSALFRPEMAAVAEAGGAPASAAYAFPVGELVFPEGARLLCAMLYAVATLPEHRGRGLGAAVAKKAAEMAIASGFECVVTKPAEEALFEFYARKTPFAEYFYAIEAELSPGGLTRGDAQCALFPVSPAEYRRLRNGLLGGLVYIDMDIKALAYQQALCRDFGGEMLAVSDGGACGCATVELDGGGVWVKELLLPGKIAPEDAISAIAARFCAKSVRVRTPPGLPAPENSSLRRFGMIAPAPPKREGAQGGFARWLGLAFD